MSRAGKHLFLILFTVATLWPVLWVVKMALEPGQDFAFSISPIPEHPSLDNFRRFVGHSDARGWIFGRQLLNSFAVSTASTLLGIFVSATAAYAFSRFRFPGRRLGLLAFLASQMFPGTLMMIPLYLLLHNLGLLDSTLGLTLVYSTTSVPFCTWMLKGYFDTIPRELEEAALIDGASRARIFWTIVLPLAAPALAVTALFSFMTAWNEFILAAKLMDSELHYTLPVVVNGAIGSKSVRWGDFAAGAVLVSTPVVALFFALQKWLVGGLTAGGVKG
jgi:arabinogalactan oligomer/maltooligosaccharide transport system permease protein